MFTYYADLNPRFPSRGQGKYAVFLRRAPGDFSQTMYSYSKLSTAERNARKLNEQEYDPKSV